MNVEFHKWHQLAAGWFQVPSESTPASLRKVPSASETISQPMPTANINPPGPIATSAS